MERTLQEQLKARGLSHSSIKKAFKVLRKLKLPIPSAGEYLAGFGGALLFLEDEALVVRIEKSDTKLHRIKRVKHPLVLQPLLSLPCDEITVEICPGTKLLEKLDDDTRDAINTSLNKELHKVGVNLWDFQTENVGIITLPDFPDQEQVVVIDRNSVEVLMGNAELFKLSRDLTHAPCEYQSQFDPLREKATQAFANDRIEEFYDKCREFKEEGRLVCGWGSKSYAKRDEYGFPSKTAMANQTAQAYAKRRKSEMKVKA